MTQDSSIDLAITLGAEPTEIANAQKIRDTVNHRLPMGSLIEATRAMRLVLAHLDVNLNDENFQETPHRFVKFLAEFLQGAPGPQVLGTDFAIKHAEYHGMVAQTNIPYRAVCAHHLLPFLGSVSIGYIPAERVVGLSKLARLVEAVGVATPGIQEIQTDDIADMMEKVLKPKGVIVVGTAIHTCMGCRGVAARNVPTITSTVRGVFRDVPAAREEFFHLINMGTRNG